MDVSSIQFEGIKIFCSAGTYFDLGVLKHFELEKSDKKNCYNSQRFRIITSLYFWVKIYYSQKELKHFGLQISVIHEILEHIVLNIFKYIFWYKCTKIRKEENLNYSKRFLNYIMCHKDFKLQIAYIKSITQLKSILFLFSHPLACTSSTICWEATLWLLILRLSFFKFFPFLKFNLLDKKAVLIRLKIKTKCLTKKSFLNGIKITYL